MNLLFCRTDRDRLQATSPGTISLAESLPQLQLYFLMGLVYSVITPVIIPFIIIFMGFAFLVYRNQVHFYYQMLNLFSLFSWSKFSRRNIFLVEVLFYALVGLSLTIKIIKFIIGATAAGYQCI